MEEDPLSPYYFEPEDDGVPPITEDYQETFPSMVDRFFTRYYYIKKGGKTAPYQVLFHSNRICLICLAPEHPALKVGVKSVNFDIGQWNRSENTVKGKGKKGGMILQPDFTLALITDSNGEVYKVPACIRSKLIEVRTSLQENPGQLAKNMEGAGYIAIVLPKIELCEEIKASLLTEIEYKEQYLSKQDETETIDHVNQVEIE